MALAAFFARMAVALELGIPPALVQVLVVRVEGAGHV
jgi:hypothetical protein